MPPPQPYVSNIPLQVASALRYTDANGDLVTQLYPNDYTSLIGSATSTLKNQYIQVNQYLANYGAAITALQADVLALETSGVTNVTMVNGSCFSGNTAIAESVAVNYLIESMCSYKTALGTPSALSAATVVYTPSELNVLPAYSQNSAMAGLAGWSTGPTTTADAINNLWLAYKDMRAGVTQALLQSNTTCADIKIFYSNIYNPSTRVVTFYFYSSSIPAVFNTADPESGLLTLTDNIGNIYTKSFDIYQATTAGFVAADISLSSLSTISNYSAVMAYSLNSTTPVLGCNGSVLGTVINNTQTCPNTTTSATANSISFTFTPSVTQDVLYTVSLYDTSGITSGTTAVSTKSYVNPASIVSDSFTDLPSSHLYQLQVSITIGTVITHCSPITISTTS